MSTPLTAPAGPVTMMSPGGYPDAPQVYPQQGQGYYRGGYRGGHERGRGYPNPRGRGQPHMRGSGLSANIQVQLQPGQHQGYPVSLGYPNQPPQQQQGQGHYVVYRDGPPQGAAFIPAPPPYEEHY